MTKYIHNRAIFKTKDKPHMNWCININMIFYQVQFQAVSRLSQMYMLCPV